MRPQTDLVLDAALLVITVITLVFLYFQWVYTYWKRRGVPHVEGTFPFGSVGNPFRLKKNLGFTMKDIYDHFRRLGCRFGGFYSVSSPRMMPVDLEMVRLLLAKDFKHFNYRGVYYNEKDDPLSAHMFAVEGEKWRKLRTKLTPTFTSGRIKQMFSILLRCSEDLNEAVEELRTSKKLMDAKKMTIAFNINVIGSAAFGLDINCFKDEESDFKKHGTKILLVSLSRRPLFTLATHLPKVGRALGVLRFERSITDFFRRILEETIAYREDNHVTRNDFLQLLMNLKERSGSGPDSANLTMEEIEAQALLFFSAGFDTSSITMTFCLYELARSQEVQDRLRQEIEEVVEKSEGQITYEGIMSMKYLHQVVDETLRLHSPVAALMRICSEEYRVPDSDVVIEKGTQVHIPVLAIHRDPKYHPNPEIFDPDRFSDENKPKMHPYSYLPFGEGPRNCIGLRFAQLQVMVGIVSLVKNFKFLVSSKTQQPVAIDPYSLVYTPRDAVWLDVQ